MFFMPVADLSPALATLLPRWSMYVPIDVLGRTVLYVLLIQIAHTARIGQNDRELYIVLTSLSQEYLRLCWSTQRMAYG